MFISYGTRDILFFRAGDAAVCDLSPHYQGADNQLNIIQDFFNDEEVITVFSRCTVVCVFQGLEPAPGNGEAVRYLTPSVALFEAIDDELLPLKPIGIQVTSATNNDIDSNTTIRRVVVK